MGKTIPGLGRTIFCLTCDAWDFNNLGTIPWQGVDGEELSIFVPSRLIVVETELG